MNMATNTNVSQDDAAVPNNNGVQLLAEGNLSNAATQFRKALISVHASAKNENIQDLRSTSTTCRTVQSKNSHSVSSDYNRVQQYPINKNNFLFPTWKRDLESFTTSSIFTTGICIQERHNFGVNDNLVTEQIIHSAIILFNLGLVFHIKGLKENQLFIGRARVLYEDCHRLLAGSGITNPTGYAEIDLLMLAVLNNRAQISYEQCEYMESKVYAEVLAKFAASIVTNSYGDSRLCNMMHELRYEFFMNMLSMRPPQVACAA